MRVIIVGAGQVGHSIAANLQDSHDVVVIDNDDSIIDELTYSLDVLAIHGDGTEQKILREAGVKKAELVIACTDSDEVNVVVCGTAKTASDAFTIARVRQRTLLTTWEGSQGAFGVDFMVCTDLLAAQAIFRIAGLPATQDVEMFAGGLVRMAEFEIDSTSPIAGQTIQEADQYDSLTFAALFRGDEMQIAAGDATIRTGDRVVVIGSPESITSFATDITPTDEIKPDEIVIVGASEIGFQTAREFEEHGYQPRLIEQNHDRAREMAELLPNTLVLESDATDVKFLETEHIGDADLVVAALGDDDKNLLVSLLARRLNINRTVAVIENPDYTDLFEAVGVDVAVNPREETAEEIIRFTRTDYTEKIAMLEHDRAEVIEIEIDRDSILVGHDISTAVTHLPDEVVIGAISRGGKLVTPRGSTVVEPGDHVIIFVDSAALDQVLNVI
ncbi:Trk system potassium transporter TrkA [Saliphagus sp. LR7]|uniref:Trk system potassium transporter TrkA n=1 Tax=Saliphagus sp. LR7 TaxID=2282654 RepID=UPI000DF73F1F|nr:Trk system potassium transporter TrkA [Saliphagus sp. LR7]